MQSNPLKIHNNQKQRELKVRQTDLPINKQIDHIDALNILFTNLDLHKIMIKYLIIFYCSFSSFFYQILQPINKRIPWPVFMACQAVYQEIVDGRVHLEYLIIHFIEQIMGSCTSGGKRQVAKTNNGVTQPVYGSARPATNTKMKQGQLDLIRLMYDDLACRSKDNVLTREVFDTFFHLNGLWGQEMFRAFDKGKQGNVTYDEFVGGIELMVKGSFQDRSKLLFKFYDLDSSGGVSYNELLKMLYSYPKEDLKEMITQQNFLKTIDNYQLLNFFKPEKQAGDMNVIEQAEETEQDKQQTGRKQSEYLPSSTEFIKMQQKFQQAMRQKKNQKLFVNNNNTLNVQKKTTAASKRAGSMLAIPTYTRKNLKLTNNVASLVKKYAVYIFNQMKLDKSKDQIKFEQFLIIVQNHQKIFNIYFEGFHSYIWMLQGNEEPAFTTITPFTQGPCIEVYKGNKNQKYLKLIKTTILVFSKKKSTRPLEVKNMEGLIVEQKKGDSGFGIIIKHRDGIYPEKEYYFENEGAQKEWMRYLQQFKENSIYNQYQIMQKIGAGNFSSVYRGIEKTTNKEVAVKVIQKFKLSQNEKEVIKFQKGILQLCHHPNIIRFYSDFNTKTRIYIVTELLTEGDLFQYTKKTTFLEEYESAIIFKQLVEAIKYLNHDLGLIHRDLKPENVLIMLNKQKNLVQRPILIDFGFAVYKMNLKNLSDREKFAGTPGFVAPEMFLGQDYDEGVDMFSLGIILYFMLCGNLPFNSPIYQQIVEQTKQCNISLKNVHWSNVSNQAKDLISRLITFKEQRINSNDCLEHPWLRDIQSLKQYNGRNKKVRYN